MTNAWPVVRGRVPEREAFALASSVLFVMFAGDGVPNAIHWVGWGVLCAALGAWSVTVAVRSRAPFTRTPRALWLFLAWCVVSIAWSHWRLATTASIAVQILCALVAFVIASTLTWRRIVDAVSLALRWVLAISLLFEAFVAAVVRHPVYPVWTSYGDAKVPDAFAFSRAELFTGGRIQGLPGNANLLAMVALLAVIAVGVQLAERRIRRGRAIGWLVVAVAVLALTRSSTVLVAAVVVAVVLGVALWIRRVPTERRTPRYLLLVVVAVVVVGLAAVFRGQLLDLLGKSSDLTGRGVIWQRVADMASQHPAVGWGWIGYWWPDVHQLSSLYSHAGVTYLQAHDAYLDVWMQTGIVGLVLFLLYVVSTLLRSWSCATRIGYDRDQAPKPFTGVAVFALLVVTALLVQSLAESRLLYQGNWILFAVIAIKSRIVLVGEEPQSIGDGPRTPAGKREFRWGGPTA